MDGKNVASMKWAFVRGKPMAKCYPYAGFALKTCRFVENFMTHWRISYGGLGSAGRLSHSTNWILNQLVDTNLRF